MSDTSDLMEDAADYIETNGWHQGGLNDGAAACVVGGLMAASGYNFFRADWKTSAQSFAYQDARTSFAKFIDVYDEAFGTDAIPSWNDTPGRTKEEVLDALRGAAKHERLREEGLL